MDRPGLWAVLAKIGCPDKFINIVRSFHDGMSARVRDGSRTSLPFMVTSGTKQGCVLAPLLFSIFFAMMIHVAFRNCSIGVPVEYRTDRNLFNLRKLQSSTKVSVNIIRDLLFADDCALAAHTLLDAQTLLDKFVAATVRFGLNISLKKTEVLLQSSDPGTYESPTVSISNATLPVTESFCYLGSRISRLGIIDDEITARLAKASAAFGRLTRRLWNDHGIRVDTKVNVYQAAVISTLLYGSESWTLYRRHIRKLNGFHMRCLRRILHLKWQDRVPDTEVLERCNIQGIEAMLMRSQFRWSGHVLRMADNRIPKQLLYGQLANAKRNPGGQRKRYKDQLKANFRACGMDYQNWEALAMNRDSWRRLCYEATSKFEVERVRVAKERRAQRKSGYATAVTEPFVCDTCGRICLSRIGLTSHRRTHRSHK